VIGNTKTSSARPGPGSSADGDRYKHLRRATTIRLLLVYLSPVVLLAAYFFWQYDAIVSESQRLHLGTVAESQAATLDLFLSERQTNLRNIIENQRRPFPPTTEHLNRHLLELQRYSPAFCDLGFFDSTGVQVAYAGPYPSLERRNYSGEKWFSDLRAEPGRAVFTDIYLGFRERPHFTVAAARIVDGEFFVMRATLDPERLNDYVGSLDGSHEVVTSILNDQGLYQVVAAAVAQPLSPSTFMPPAEPRRGVRSDRVASGTVRYAYAWVNSLDWVLVVQAKPDIQPAYLSGFRLNMLLTALAMITIGFIIIVFRAKRQVEIRQESDTTRAQLGHAAKLASVGELASGIAHEINNPLASINEEAGLLKDLLDPSMGQTIGREEIVRYLDSIQESVFRCRDITRKLLKFVRRTDVSLSPQNIHARIDAVIDGILGHELSVSNIKVERQYAEDIPDIITDGNQFEQVLLNIVNNAIDAMHGEAGSITIQTVRRDDQIRIAVTDTGEGMTSELMENIFMPFYTTKEVGKGTGLGLSVSYGIMKSLGGNIEVQSVYGRGSTFTLVLPVEQAR
jgi:two-component system NtrC family sensor kinase